MATFITHYSRNDHLERLNSYTQNAKFKTMKNIKLVGYVIAGIVLAGTFIDSLQNEKELLLGMSRETFLKAVDQDLNNRTALWEGHIAFSKHTKDKKYKNLTIEKEDTKEKYSLDSLDYAKNVDEDMQRRMLHTAAIITRKFAHPDTLNQLWQKELHSQNISGKTYLKIEIKTKGLHTTTQSSDSLACEHADNLPISYAGAKNEMTLHAYIHLSHCSIINRSYRLCILLGVIACWIIWPFILLFFRRKTESIETNDQKLTEEQEEQKEDISERIPPEILCATEGMYRLSENIFYVPLSRCIYCNTGILKLSKHKNLLLEHLVKAEAHRMHGVDLAIAVWEEDSVNLDRLYTLNSRLRVDLRKLGEGFALESLEDGYFQLITPLFSKNERY